MNTILQTMYRRYSLMQATFVSYHKDGVYRQAGRVKNFDLNWKFKSGFLSPTRLNSNVRILEELQRRDDKGEFISLIPKRSYIRVICRIHGEVTYKSKLYITDSRWYNEWALKRTYPNLLTKTQ